jgi:5'-3' exonuclease
VKTLADYKPYKVMFVDAMNLMARNHYAMSMLEYRGVKTGMLMGAARLVIDWRKKNPGIEFVFVWEGKNSWRKEKYPVYKSNRGNHDPDSRAEFTAALNLVKSNLHVLGVHQVWANTFEADDTVYRAMDRWEGLKMIFNSTDWDWWPLSKYGDFLYQDDVYTADDLRAKFNKKYGGDIDFDRLWVFKTLTGDPSDGIKGVPRFLKKVAIELANDASIGEDLIHGAIIHGYDKIAEKMISNRWIIERNEELVKPKIPDISEMQWESSFYDEELFKSVLFDYGMAGMLDRLEK